MYSFRKKRGPVKNEGEDLKSVKRRRVGVKVENEEGVAVDISPYVRRLFTVFFTIFKNQEATVSQSKDRALGWCWFARQLSLIKKHCKDVGNHSLCVLVDDFLATLDLKIQKLDSSLKATCPIAPGACEQCSALVLGTSAGQGVFGNRPGTVSKCSVPCHDFDRVDLMSDYMKNQLAVFENNEEPGIYFKLNDSPSTHEITVNPKFEQVFGQSKYDLEALLKWSGNGFLPWGSDVIAKLIVSEQDLALYVKVLCLKFQALECPGPNYMKEVPSTHVFSFWVKDGANGWKEQQCLLNCVHRVMKSGHHVSHRMVFNFSLLGTAEPQVSNENPVAYSNEGFAAPGPPRPSSDGKRLVKRVSFPLEDGTIVTPDLDFSGEAANEFLESWKFPPDSNEYFFPSEAPSADGGGGGDQGLEIASPNNVDGEGMTRIQDEWVDSLSRFMRFNSSGSVLVGTGAEGEK